MLTVDDIRGRKMVNAAHVDYSRPKGHAWIGTVEGLPRLGVAKGQQGGQAFVRWSVDGKPARDLDHALAVLNGEASIGATPASPSGAGRQPDLQEMVERAGGFDKITDAMWAEHDRAVAAWWVAYRKDLLNRKKL